MVWSPSWRRAAAGDELTQAITAANPAAAAAATSTAIAGPTVTATTTTGTSRAP